MIITPSITDWDRIPLKRLFRRTRVACHPQEELLSVYRDHGVVPRSSRTDNFNRPSEDLSKYLLVNPGDLVVNKMKAWQGSMGISRHRGIVSPAYFVYRPLTKFDDRFLHYVLRSKPYWSFYRSISGGIRPNQWDLDASEFEAMPVALPEFSDQVQLANFLDRETAQIDAMIEAQENVVNLVRERRESFITEAISDFPRVPLKRLIDPDRPLTYGILQAGVPQLDGVPYIGPADIPGEGVAPKLEDLRLTTKEIAAKYHRSVLKAGDVVVSIGPAYGRVMVTTSDLEGSNLTQDTARVALKNTIANSHFVVWALCSFIATEFWDKMINGATFRRLNLGTLGDTPIPFPPISEQRSIAKSLQIETAKADQIIDAANEVIALLRERREALITAAITGRIDPETGIEYPENPETPKES